MRYIDSVEIEHETKFEPHWHESGESTRRSRCVATRVKIELTFLDPQEAEEFVQRLRDIINRQVER
jgi:hypothetical protein